MGFEVLAAPSPAWVDALVEVVRAAMEPLGFIGHLGYRLWEPCSPHNSFSGWMLAVFPTPNEWHGGQHDGAVAVSGFKLDLKAVLGAFQSLDAVAWNNPVQYNGNLDGPELVVQGNVLGKRVLLRVYSLPPPDEPVSYVVDPSRGEAWTRVEEAG